MISDEALEVWLSLALDTGDGPWDWDSRGKYYEVTDSKSWLVAQCESRKEAMFIAEARTAIPALIAEVRELRGSLNREVEHLTLALHERVKLQERVAQLEQELDIEKQKAVQLEEENTCLSKKVQWYTDNAPFYDDAHTDVRVAQLEKEADWLAENLAHKDFCNMNYNTPLGCISDCSCKKCWRESARKATESE